MNIQEFMDLPENIREELTRRHEKVKYIRKAMDRIKCDERALRTRKLNLQLECEHPYKITKYQAHENEFGNYIGGGEYTHKCPDCESYWTSQDA